VQLEVVHGNRGACAAPCRKPYKLFCNNTLLDTGYLLSTKDLFGLEHVKKLMEIGVSCFKIEGRLKSPDYVGIVTRIYRKYIDTPSQPSYEDTNMLLQAFNRGGISYGHLNGRNEELVYSKEPDKHNTLSKELLIDIKNTYSGKEYKKIKLDGKLVVQKEKPITLSISCNDGIYENTNFTLYSNIIPEPANSSAITKERIASQLCKTGSTEFEFSSLEIELDDGLHLPSLSELNELRRTAISKLELMAKQKYEKSLKQISLSKMASISKPKSKEISILINSFNPEINYLLLDVHNIYIPLDTFTNNNYSEALKKLSDNKNVYVYMPLILKDTVYKDISLILDSITQTFNIKGFVISHISQIDICKKYNLINIGNYSLNIMNSNTIESLKELGISRFTISPELDRHNVKELSNSCNSEFIVYGKLPVMTLNYCLVGKTNGCSNSCKNSCAKNKFFIKDTLGYEFDIIPNNKSTITTIYNSKITSIDFTKLNLNVARIDFLYETFDEMNLVIKKVREGEKLEGLDYTNGNFNRTV
jgi:putative protease